MMSYGFFDFFDIIIPITFTLCLGIFAFVLIKGIKEWNSNNHSPRLRVPAFVVAKRTDTTHHHTDAGASGMSHCDTSYYVTFEVESGDRMEFYLSGSEYGMLAEGDQGMLSLQGTRYLGFERQIDDYAQD